MNGSTLIPTMRYRDAHAAIDWLCRVLGFSRRAVYDGPDNTVDHAELTLGSGMVMLGSVKPEGVWNHIEAMPDEIGNRQTGGVYLVVEDCAAAFETAKREGAEILQELTSPDYGGQAFVCRDPEGRVWSVGSYDPWAVPEGAA